MQAGAMFNKFSKLDRKHYPALDLILWDRADQYISTHDAFAAYELRWRYIDEAELTVKEKKLIKELTKHLGNGLFLTA